MSDTFLEDLANRAAPIHLVLDGAIVGNIENHLALFELTGRPLFRETADRETVLAGPWLIPCAGDYKQLEQQVAAARAAGKGVFWLGERDPEVLYKHLRHLNAARMPDGAVLYFRHYDSDVLAAIVPLLDGQQAAHLFGPARVISLIGGSADGGSVEKPEGLPGITSGPIAFEPWQIEALDKRQEELSRQKIAKCLRNEFSRETAGMSDAQVYSKVVQYQRECHEMNLTSEWSLAQYARFNMESNDRGSRNVAWRTKIATELPPSDADYIFQRGMYDLRRDNLQRKIAKCVDSAS